MMTEMNCKPRICERVLGVFKMVTVAAPLIAAVSDQKIFSCQLAAASIQKWPLIKKQFYSYTEVDLKSFLSIFLIIFIIKMSLIHNTFLKNL